MSGLTLQPLVSRLFPALAAVVLAAGVPANAQERPTVVTVNHALGYFTERLGGGDLDVVFPVPDGVDPSFWRPSISDISSIQGADLIVLNGAGFATWTAKASLPRSRIVDTSRGFEDRFIATETITHSHGESGEHSHTGTASYTWLDQEQAILQAGAIADALVQRGLVEPDVIDTRLAALKDDLQTLDAAADRLRPLAEGKVMIATHPRYQYLARAYGLDIRSLEWEAGAAPDAGQIAALETMVDETGARVLLWEAQPPEEARAAIRELGLADIVFPTMAVSPDNSDYLQTLGKAVEELSAALKGTDG